MDSVHSRFPVHDRSPDKILGVLQVRDVLVASVRGARPDLHALVRAAPVVADTVDTLDVVDILKRSIVHMALVHDEYGHFEGIVTSADILEAIVGDFRTEKGLPNRMSCSARMARGLFQEACRWMKWQSGYPFSFRHNAHITRLPVSYCIRLGTYQQWEKALTCRAGGLR